MFSAGPSLFGNSKESKPVIDSTSVEKTSTGNALGNGSAGGIFGKTSTGGGLLGNSTNGGFLGNPSSLPGKQ